MLPRPNIIQTAWSRTRGGHRADRVLASHWTAELWDYRGDARRTGIAAKLAHAFSR